MQLLKSIYYKSWTKLLGYAQAISGAGLLALTEVNSFVTDPTFKGFLDQMDLPKYVTLGLLILGLITWLAHGRRED